MLQLQIQINKNIKENISLSCFADINKSIKRLEKKHGLSENQKSKLLAIINEQWNDFNA